MVRGDVGHKYLLGIEMRQEMACEMMKDHVSKNIRTSKIPTLHSYPPMDLLLFHPKLKAKEYVKGTERKAEGPCH